MGVEPRRAADMIALVRRAQAAGLDAAQLYSLDPGHGRRPRPDEQEAYFRDVLDAVDFPSIISTHQSVGYFVRPELLARLIDEYPQVIGVNVTNPDPTYLVRVLDAVRDRVDVHVGGPVQAVTALALGAQGYLVSEANLAPKVCAHVVDGWERADLDASARAFTTVMRLFAVVQAHGGVSGIKAALTRLGLPGGLPRKPRIEIPTDWCDAIVDTFHALGLGAIEGI
jgi:4-hydroxy-tetrahydrodipicolinate synthase